MLWRTDKHKYTRTLYLVRWDRIIGNVAENEYFKIKIYSDEDIEHALNNVSLCCLLFNMLII